MALALAVALGLAAGPAGASASDGPAATGGVGAPVVTSAASAVQDAAGPARAGVGRAAPARSWTWPLAGAPAVLEPFAAPEHRWSPGHRGVDLRGVGEEVLAPTGGTVTFAGPVVDRSVLVVAAPGGLSATLEPVVASVAVGDVVRAGQVVGTLEEGGSSHCDPTCLHWGVRRGTGRDATYLDPLLVLAAQGAPGPPVLLPP